MSRVQWTSALQQWNRALETYNRAVELRSLSAPSKKDLPELDVKVRGLADAVRARDPPHLSAGELSEIVRWKLKRGKFRPRLQKLAESNKEAAVADCSSRAFREAADGHLLPALKILEELSGVGPATASAVLSAAFPDRCAFMSDEALASVPSMKGQVAYTHKAFELLQTDTADKARELDQLRVSGSVDSGTSWTPSAVERALWSSAMGTLYGDGEREQVVAQPKSRKRRRK